jgi:hypothetical protein
MSSNHLEKLQLSKNIINQNLDESDYSVEDIEFPTLKRSSLKNILHTISGNKHKIINNHNEECNKLPKIHN